MQIWGARDNWGVKPVFADQVCSFFANVTPSKSPKASDTFHICVTTANCLTIFMLEYSGLGVLPVFSQTVGGCLEVTRKNMLGCEENFPILPTGLASTVYRTGWA